MSNQVNEIVHAPFSVEINLQPQTGTDTLREEDYKHFSKGNQMAESEELPIGQISCTLGRLLVGTGQTLIRYSPTAESVANVHSNLQEATLLLKQLNDHFYGKDSK